MTHRILHINLDAFFVLIEQLESLELQGKPVIVGGRPDRRGVVTTASYEARGFGFPAMQTGQTLLVKDISPSREGGYTLHTPGLLR